MAEDSSKNRLEEALDLFEQIVNSHYFKEVDIMVFLNKVALRTICSGSLSACSARSHAKLTGLGACMGCIQRDLFAEKIKEVDPVQWFPDYKGGCNYDAAEQYFKNAFRGRGMKSCALPPALVSNQRPIRGWEGGKSTRSTRMLSSI